MKWNTDDLSDDLYRLYRDELFSVFGLSPDNLKKGRNNRGTVQSQYHWGNAVDPDPQVRWAQHLDRMKRGKRLTGNGEEIDEERR